MAFPKYYKYYPSVLQTKINLSKQIQNESTF